MRSIGATTTERDYAKVPLTEAELREIVRLAGVAKVLNTRHALAKDHGWKERAPSVEVFVRAALTEPNLLRRPILVHEGALVVGKDEAAIRALLAR